MGVINITPDSFSDGGRYLCPDRALAMASRQLTMGADIIDLGAQSTRPGAVEVGATEELRRLLPVLQALRELNHTTLLSVDTFLADVAAKALIAGADWINDISGGRHDPAMLSLAAEASCPIVLTHSRGKSHNMDTLAVYSDIVGDVREELLHCTEAALQAGVSTSNIIWDPGLGFAKTTEHNLELLRSINLLQEEGFPLLLGPSRKRFIGAVLKQPRPRARIWGTAAICTAAVLAGVEVVRVHDVGPIVQTVQMAEVLKHEALINYKKGSFQAATPSIRSSTS